MKINKVTPIQVVERIEPALPFYEGVLGYQRVVEVPHEEHLGFVLLVRDGDALMLQSRPSAQADVPALARQGSALYIDVASLDEARGAVSGREVIVERTTFYGAREIWFREPSGVLVALAEHHA